MKRAALAVTLLLTCLPVSAQSVYVVPDVPTDVGPTLLLPWSVGRGTDGVWSVVLTLPEGATADAIDLLPGGDWLVSFDLPVRLGGIDADPRDVLRFDGVTWTRYLDGRVAGVPDGVGVDALSADEATGALVLSFDAPLRLGGAIVEPADLVRWTGAEWRIELDASAARPAVPPTSNVIGADRFDGAWLVAFDVPTSLGAMTVLPGQIAAWDGSVWSLRSANLDWPQGSRINALAFQAGAGAVPADLRLDKSPSDPSVVLLYWNPSCSLAVEDYAIYEGEIGDWYSHGQSDCTDDGRDQREELRPAPGNRYFIVVPRNAGEEGSYGTTFLDGAFFERPQPLLKSERCVSVQGPTGCF